LIKKKETEELSI